MSKTIICDFDGVWADSFDVLYRINEIAATALGLKLTPQQYRAAFHGPIHCELRKLLNFDDAQQTEFSNHKRRIFPAHYHTKSVRFFPFAAATIAKLSQLGQLHIVTASPAEAVAALLEEQGLRNYFDEVAGFNLAGKRATLERLAAQTPLSSSFFITDTIGDVREAAGLPLTTIAVSWGFHQREDLQAAGAHRIASNGDELAEAILHSDASALNR
jgi:phosphoglycolate phosphatase